MVATQTSRGTVLVVEDEADIAKVVELTLSLEGFAVEVCRDGLSAMDSAIASRPDLILLDVSLPGLDGFEVCRRLRANARTSHCAVVMVTARNLSADTVIGLTAGADDYIPKPFQPAELVARVHAAMRRVRELRDVSPLTGLPGNSEILRQLDGLLRTGSSFALVHADIDHFKAYNDRYGFVRGDQAIVASAELLTDVVGEHAARRDGGALGFVGHVGGDDFVLLVDAADAPEVCVAVVARFDGMVPSLYDPADAAHGWVEVIDRRKQLSRIPLMTISLGVATSERPFTSVAEVVAVATEMKMVAKAANESAWRIDRRLS